MKMFFGEYGLMLRRIALLTLQVIWIGAGLLSTGTAVTASSYYIYSEFGGRYYDAEKNPFNLQDDSMCWAAAASNILAWTGWGYAAGRGFSSEDQMFAHFQDHWTDNGGNALYAWEWWFSGVHSSPTGFGFAVVDVLGGGGFWPNENLSGYYRREGDPALAMSAVSTFLHAGLGVALTLWDGYRSAHQITAWGYEYDPTGSLGVYVTDSDDDMNAANPGDVLRYYRVSTGAGSRWYLNDYLGDSDWFISEVQGLAQFPGGTPVPLPSAIWMFGSGLLGAVGLRVKFRVEARRRR